MPPEKTRKEGGIKTLKEVDVIRSGISTGTFEEEKALFIEGLKELEQSSRLAVRHPKFGKFNRYQWGCFTYSHINYHFSQFGA